MCWCTPEIRTPNCGKLNCKAPLPPAKGLSEMLESASKQLTFKFMIFAEEWRCDIGLKNSTLDKPTIGFGPTPEEALSNALREVGGE